MWLRVFGRLQQIVSPARLVDRLIQAGYPVVPTFKGDHLGWTEGSLALESGSPILLSRYLTKEDDLRNDLNAYAAELEGYSFQQNAASLMEKVIQTQQMMTIRKPVDHANESRLDSMCELICQLIAGETDGVYQIDGRGWFAAEGMKLVEEY